MRTTASVNRSPKNHFPTRPHPAYPRRMPQPPRTPACRPSTRSPSAPAPTGGRRSGRPTLRLRSGQGPSACWRRPAHSRWRRKVARPPRFSPILESYNPLRRKPARMAEIRGGAGVAGRHLYPRFVCAQGLHASRQIPPGVKSCPASPSASLSASAQLASSPASTERITKLAPTLPSRKNG